MILGLNRFRMLSAGSGIRYAPGGYHLRFFINILALLLVTLVGGVVFLLFALSALILNPEGS